MADIETTKEMTVTEYLDRIQATVNQFIQDAKSANGRFESALAQLTADPAYKALEAKQPTLVKAIVEAEMSRIATEVGIA